MFVAYLGNKKSASFIFVFFPARNRWRFLLSAFNLPLVSWCNEVMDRI